MTTWDSKVYPQSAKLERFVADISNLGPQGRLAAQKMVDAFGEYEHGTADIEDVFSDIEHFDLSEIDDELVRRKFCLELYRRVLEDAILVLANG